MALMVGIIKTNQIVQPDSLPGLRQSNQMNLVVYEAKDQPGESQFDRLKVF